MVEVGRFVDGLKAADVNTSPRFNGRRSIMKNKFSVLLACLAFTIPGFADGENETEPLTVSFTESMYFVSEGQIWIFEAIATGGVGSYNWEFSGGGDISWYDTYVSPDQLSARFYVTIGHNLMGEQSVTVTVTDSNGTMAEATASIYSIPDQAPEVTSRSPDASEIATNRGERLAFSVNASDSELSELTYSWVVNIEYPNFDCAEYASSGDTSDSSFTFTPAEVGVYTVSCSISDGYNITETMWTVHVEDRFQVWLSTNGLSGGDAAWDAKPAKWGGTWANALVYTFGEGLVSGETTLLSISFDASGKPVITTPPVVEDHTGFTISVIGTGNLNEWSSPVILEPDSTGTSWSLPDGATARFFRVRLTQ